jgi:hypothetical protein
VKQQMQAQVVKILLIVIVILLGIIAALVMAWLSRASGDKPVTIVTKASAAFAGTVTLSLVIEHELT